MCACMCAAVCGVSSVELSWRPPTKNAERIEKYKLMIATTTGVVKDVYQGREQRYKVCVVCREGCEGAMGGGSALGS